MLFAKKYDTMVLVKKLRFVYATDNYSKPSDYRMGIELLAVRLND